MYSAITNFKRNNECLLHQLVVDDDQIIFATISGSKSAVQANLSGMKKGKTFRFSWHKDGLRVYSAKGSTDVKTIVRPLPKSLGVIATCYHSALTSFGQISSKFYLLSTTSKPDLEFFYFQLNRASSIPMLPQWSSFIWMNGLKNFWIVPIASHGKVKCWRIDVSDEILKDHILQGLKIQEISHSPNESAAKPSGGNI